MFLVLWIASITAYLSPALFPSMRRLIMGVAALGIAFSGYFTATELPAVLAGQTNYALILPSCAYGLFVYLAILIAAYLAPRR